MSKLNKILVVPDAHHPYHSIPAWEMMLEIGKAWRPNTLVCLGDLVDFAGASVYTKDPREIVSIDEEISAGNKAIDDMTSIGASKNYLIEGNHEVRVKNRILEKLPEFVNQFPSCYEMLQMHRRKKWEWTNYTEFVKIGKLSFAHQVGHAGKTALQLSAQSFGDNIVIGHCHRAGVWYWGTVHEGTRVAITGGWLGDKDKIHYMHKANIKDWQLGFTTIYQNQDGVSWCTFNPFIERDNRLHCIFEGKEYVKPL